ncbi:MAG: protein kinase domain-containing protein [Actinomycetes bacterium]
MDRIGDYVLLRELGRGEHSRVYLARTPGRLGLGSESLALKVLSFDAADGFEKVADDLSLFAGLASPWLLPLYEVGVDGGAVFYAMRHEGMGCLAAPMRELTRRERLSAVARAARGAHEMHEAGLVHRGIGPNNILLDRGGAVLAEPAVGHHLTHGQTLSGLGAGLGGAHLELVDPALMRGRPAGRASDIWSLGVTLHRALTGHGLFPALVSADPFTAVRIYLRSQPELGEDMTDAERRVVVTALHPDPARRYPTAQDLADAVEETARHPRS